MNGYPITDRRTGAALLAVMTVLMIVSALLGTIMTVSKQNAHMAKMLADRVRALAYAEAGVSEAYATLATNFSLCTNGAAFPAKNYAAGTYDVTVTPVSTNVAVISCKARCRSADAEVIVDIRNYGTGNAGTVAPAGTAWEKSVFAGSQLAINGNGTFKGKLHSNKAMKYSGGLDFGTDYLENSSSLSITVSGQIKTPGILKAPTIVPGSSNPGGATIQPGPVPTVAFPPLDLTPYYNIAVKNGAVYPGGNYNNAVNWTGVPGGVIWVNGDIRIGGNFKFDGLLICTGNITIQGNVDQHKINGLGGIVSRDGAIKFGGGHNGEGLVYAPGDITFGGQNFIKGQIMSGGTVTGNGNLGALEFEYSPLPLAMPDTFKDKVAISAWQK